MDNQIFTELEGTFADKFGHQPAHHFFSPGRVNLIGEHTDYNGGHVFPAAITIGTFGVASSREDNLVKVYSLNFPDQGVVTFDINDEEKLAGNAWPNFIKGLLIELRAEGYSFDHGFELAVNGTIPTASGLSSSSSLELLISVVLDRLFALDVPRLTMVQVSQRDENHYIGVQTGIMDQFAIGFGEAEKAIYLDTNTLEYELVPAIFGDNVIVIMNTNKPRALTESKYDERVAQTKEALARLQTKLDIQNLGELDKATFDANTDLIDDELLIKRGRHAVYENIRAKEAVAALKANDLVLFGQLINDSHASLKDDYEVTGIELDTLAETAQQVPGVLGARMTGAGFGGTAIALVNKDEVVHLEAIVAAKYEEVVGYAPSFYVAEIGDGAKALD